MQCVTSMAKSITAGFLSVLLFLSPFVSAKQLQIHKLNMWMKQLDKGWIAGVTGQEMGSNFAPLRHCEQHYSRQTCHTPEFGISCYNYCVYMGQTPHISCENAMGTTFCATRGDLSKFFAKFERNARLHRSMLTHVMSGCFAHAVCEVGTNILEMVTPPPSTSSTTVRTTTTTTLSPTTPSTTTTTTSTITNAPNRSRGRGRGRGSNQRAPTRPSPVPTLPPFTGTMPTVHHSTPSAITWQTIGVPTRRTTTAPENLAGLIRTLLPFVPHTARTTTTTPTTTTTTTVPPTTTATTTVPPTTESPYEYSKFTLSPPLKFLGGNGKFNPGRWFNYIHMIGGRR